MNHVPNYDRPCIVCGATPTVDILETYGPFTRGMKVVHTDLCGPCTWGEAETIDPEKW